MIKAFDLIKCILVFFFLSGFIRSIAIKATGYLAGSLLLDASILVIFLVYILHLTKERYRTVRIDGVKIFLFLLLMLGLFQGIYFLATFNNSGIDLIVRSFAPFRRYLFPLVLFWVFNYLMYKDLRKNGDQVFEKLLRFFNAVLFVAVFYQIGEALLREIPAFNEFYTSFFIAPTMNADAGTKIIFNSFVDMHKTFFPLGIRISVIRVFGIGLDMFISGSIILLCYLYNVLFSQRFKIVSLFNLVVFIAISFTGSLQFILPFFLINLYVLFYQVKVKKLLRILIGLMLLVVVGSFTARVFDPAAGYGTLFVKVIPEIIRNTGLIMFGVGPIRTNLDITNTMVDQFGPAQAYFLENITDIGLFTIMIEIGLVLYVLFFMFYLGVAFSSAKEGLMNAVQKENMRKLKIINVFCFFVFISHYSILFSRLTIAFCLLLLSLAYSYGVYLKEKGVGVNGQTS